MAPLSDDEVVLHPYAPATSINDANKNGTSFHVRLLPRFPATQSPHQPAISCSFIRTLSENRRQVAAGTSGFQWFAHPHAVPEIFAIVSTRSLFTLPAFLCMIETIISQVTGSSPSFQQS